MAGEREAQHVDAILNWPETQELFDAARRCFGRFYSELNPLDVPTHEPSNQEISDLLHYLAEKTLGDNTQHSIYASSHQNTTAWLYAPGSPWNPLHGGIQRSLGVEKTIPSSTTVGPGLSSSFPPLGSGPRNAANNETQLFSSIPLPQPAESQNLDTLSSALAKTHGQFFQHGTNSLTYPSTNVPRKNGRSSIAYSNDTSQVDFAWSHESLKTSITIPPFQGTPNKPSHQTVIAGAGPLSVSSKSLEDNCSNSVTHEQVASSAVGLGTHRLTYAEAARSNSGQVQEMPESAASPATTIGSNLQKTKFHCSYQGCDKTFEWEWKFTDHWKVHSKEKPFCCSACHAYFGRDRDLVKHKQSQKHKKAIQLQGLSTQNVTPSADTNSRTLGPAVRTRGGGPGSFPRPSRGRRAGGNGRHSPAAASSVAGRSHGEMEVSGEEADGTAQPPSGSAAGGNLTQANTCTSSRSVKRMRTISDIDANNGVENSIEAPEDPDSESFGAGASPISSRSRSLAPYPPIPPPRSNRNRSSLSRRRPNLQSRIPDASANVSSNNVPATAFGQFHRPAMLPVAESQCAAWVHAAADDRTTASSAVTDDYMQLYINMDYDPPQTTHAPQQPNLWHTGGVDTLSTIPTGEYPRDLPTRSYSAESDGHG